MILKALAGTHSDSTFFKNVLFSLKCFRNPDISSNSMDDLKPAAFMKSSSRMSEHEKNELVDNEDTSEVFTDHLNRTGEIITRDVIEDILASLTDKDDDPSTLTMTPNKPAASSSVGSFSHLMAYRAINEEIFTPHRFTQVHRLKN